MGAKAQLAAYNKKVDELSAEEFFFSKDCYLCNDILCDDERKKNLKKLLFGPYYTWKRTMLNSPKTSETGGSEQKKPEFLVCKEAGCCCVQYFKYALVEGRKEQKLSQRDIVADRGVYRFVFENARI